MARGEKREYQPRSSSTNRKNNESSYLSLWVEGAEVISGIIIIVVLGGGMLWLTIRAFYITAAAVGFATAVFAIPVIVGWCRINLYEWRFGEEWPF